MTIDPSAMTTAIGSIQNSLDLMSERILRDATAILFGITSLNLSCSLLGLPLNATAQSNFMKHILGAGLGACGIRGIGRVGRGTEDMNVVEILKGSSQIVAGITGTLFVYSLDSKIMGVAHQALAIGLPSCLMAKRGLNDLAKGCYRLGLAKIVVGLGGMAGAAYCVYSSNECPALMNNQPLSVEQMAFLDAHKQEIERLRRNGMCIGNWTDARHNGGTGKSTFAHPDLPGMLIKLPYEGLSEKGQSRAYHANLQKMRCIAHSHSFDHIVLPESHLYSISNNPIIVEQRFKLDDYRSLSTFNQEIIRSQFDKFVKATGLCFVDFTSDFNVGVVSSDDDYKQIAILDFSCIDNGEASLTESLTLATGTTALSVAAGVAKKILKIDPLKVLLFGLAAGTLSAYTSVQKDFSEGEAIEHAGLAMGYAAIAITGATLVATIEEKVFYPLIKNYLT